MTERIRSPMHTPLANAELAIMEVLWQEDELTARSIREQLYPTATKAQHGTVQKLLQRLEAKGFVERSSEQPYVFSPLICREAYAGSQLESLVDKLTGGSLAPMITHLMENKKISRAELNRLRKILDDQPIGKPGMKSVATRNKGKRP